MNGGWIQVMGPLDRIEQFKAIEPALPPSGGIPGAGLQQLRWPPSNIADTAAEARARMFGLPGSRYSDPEFSWKFAVRAGCDRLCQGAGARTAVRGRPVRRRRHPADAWADHLFRFDLTGNRRNIAVDDPRLEDRVADNTAKHDITESESLLIGRDFGVGTDIETGPNGNLFVVSVSEGAIFEVFRR